MNHGRHEFSAATKRALAERSGYLCAFDDCFKLTIGPGRENADSTTKIGVACHIHAASPGGKRYDADQTEAQRKHINNGIWMCQVHAKVIDDDEVIHTADLLRQWKQAAIKRADVWVKEGKHPWSHPKLQLHPFLKLEAWVASRWGRTVDEHAGIFPTLEEFDNQAVYLSEDHAESVLRHLRESRLALVQGVGSCGKSVFGVNLAMAWRREEKGACLWLDLRDEEDDGRGQLKSVLCGFSAWHGPLLLVVDNAHLDERLVQWLRDELMSRSLALPHIHVLFLARPVARFTPGQRNVMQQMAIQSVELRATLQAFMGVARRLFARQKKSPVWPEQDYATWINRFAGDLIAFGQAVAATLDTGGRGKPDPKNAVDHVRRHYLLKARRAHVGDWPFLRMCALATLDLDCSERGLGGAFDVLYSELAQDGLAMHGSRGGHAFWQFQHAGLGELVLRAVALEQSLSMQSFRQRILYEYVAANPHRLISVVLRLNRPEYASATDFEVFKSRLEPQVVEDGIVHNLIGARILVRHLALIPDWDDLLVRRKQEVLARLAQTPPHFVVRFLKYVGKERGEALLVELLKEDYGKVLAQTPPQFVVTFLKYVGEERGEALLVELLKGDYGKVLAQTPPGDVVTFLKHVGKKRGEALLVELLKGDYGKVLAQTPPGDVVTFLKYLGEERGEALLVELLEGEYGKVLAQTPPDDVATFLKYVGEERGEALLVELLEGGYGKVLANSRLNSVIPFFRIMMSGYAPEILARDSFEAWLNTLLRNPLQREMLNHLSGLMNLLYDISPSWFSRIEEWLLANQDAIVAWNLEASIELKYALSNALYGHGLSANLLELIYLDS